ncbi:pectin lyase fold/virulence factor [Plectosphaerella plurivora]|uniref:pectin lyase n=1 Tax=Plectosphaerella plurivora TaxID=936078 RepID=A0A9P8VJS0_9PEZI|nr:pectin lyase fold/virulence factor [Plectosphaerella plurivora]
MTRGGSHPCPKTTGTGLVPSNLHTLSGSRNRLFASRLTISNSEFDGTTSTSASCNGDHYWTMMFYGKGDRVTIDRNYYHDVSGRAPKLGQPGSTGVFQASNNYFKNMKGHAFDIYPGATALIEGNIFESVDIPMTDNSAKVSTVFDVPDAASASACSSSLGRACQLNSFSASGKWPSLKNSGALSNLAKSKNYLVKPVASNQVGGIISSSVGPTRLSRRSLGRREHI